MSDEKIMTTSETVAVAGLVVLVAVLIGLSVRGASRWHRESPWYSEFDESSWDRSQKDGEDEA